MKNFFRLLGILTLIAIIDALAFTACQNGDGNGNDSGNGSGYGDTSKIAGTKWKAQVNAGDSAYAWDYYRSSSGSNYKVSIISFTNVFFGYGDIAYSGTFIIEGKKITCTSRTDSATSSSYEIYYKKTFEIIDETTLLDVDGIKWTKL